MYRVYNHGCAFCKLVLVYVPKWSIKETWNCVKKYISKPFCQVFSAPFVTAILLNKERYKLNKISITFFK